MSILLFGGQVSWMERGRIIERTKERCVFKRISFGSYDTEPELLHHGACI